MTTSTTTRRVPFFTPILDAERRVMMEEERRTLLLRERKRKEKKDVENEAHETRDDDFSNVSSFSGVKCALNAEINGKFILLGGDDDDEKRNTGGETIKPDASRIVALDDLWRREEDNNNKEDEKEDEEAKKVFVKSLASVNVTSEEEGTTRVVDVRASAEKYWERETVDRSGGEGEGSDDEKTLGAKNFIVEAASRNGGVVGEKFLFERLERVFPQTVFARAPVESFVFEGDDDDCEEEEEEERKQKQKQNRYKYDAIVYNASDETSKFRYHIDGDPMTLLHPKSAFAEAYGGNYANRATYEKNKNEKARIKPRFISLLVYLNDEWDPEWGGETKFLDEDSQIGLLVAAKPGRVVLFDSDVKHSACATTMPPRDDESNNKNKKRFSLVMKLIALPKKVLLNEEKNEDDDDKEEEEEEEEEEVDLLRVNPNLGFGAATPIGSAKRLRDVVEAFSRKSSIK